METVPTVDSRIDLLGLCGQPVFLKLHRADVVQRRVQPGPVVPDQTRDGFVLGIAPRREALPVQPLDFQ